MNDAVRAWLISQLGPGTDVTDLTARYTRLGNARAVAIEVVRERLAVLLVSPGSVSVNGVVSVNFAANITAYERQLLSLESGEPPAPDDPDTGTEDSDGSLGVIQLIARPRR